MDLPVFLSYARRDLDVYLDQFQMDLTDELRLLSGGEDVRLFMDREISAGSSWTESIEVALRTSRAMVAVLSPQYLASAYTGREWEYFRRVEELEGPGFQPILPVLWAPPDQVLPRLPSTLANIQFVSREFPAVYREEGLRFIMKLRKYKDEYLTCLHLFAEHLLSILERQASLPSAVWTLDNIPSAFQVGNAPMPTSPPGKGPRYVRGVIIAPTFDEAARIRQDRRAYGATSDDWKPFHLESAETALGLLQQTATDGGYLFEAAVPGPELVRTLDEAARLGNLVCVVVDPWVVRLGSLYRALLDFDARGYDNAAVVVPWGSDAESAAAHPMLDVGLRAALWRTEERGRSTLFVTSAAGLQGELAVHLERLRMDAIERFGPALVGPPAAKPSIERIDIG